MAVLEFAPPLPLYNVDRSHVVTSLVGPLNMLIHTVLARTPLLSATMLLLDIIRDVVCLLRSHQHNIERWGGGRMGIEHLTTAQLCTSVPTIFVQDCSRPSGSCVIAVVDRLKWA